MTLPFGLSELLDKLLILSRQKERLRNYVKQLTQLLRHFLYLLNVLLEQILPRQLLTPCKVIHFLEFYQRVEIYLRL